MRSLREPGLGVEFFKASRPNGRDFLFSFRASSEVWDQLSFDFVNSEAFSFDQSMTALKTIIFPSNGKRARNGNGHSP